MAQRTLITHDWQFLETPLGTNPAEVPALSGWTGVDIPHDWLIQDPEDLYRDGEGWYRRILTLADAADGRRRALRFEGIYQDATIWVNGREAFVWKYGYTTFEFDITPFLHAGDNQVLVRAVFRNPNSRWYSGAGIYRRVWLVERTACHLEADGTYIVARKSGGSQWTVEVETTLVLDGRGSALVLEQTIHDAGGKPLASGRMDIPAGSAGTRTVRQTLVLESPRLWDTADPHIHTLDSILSDIGAGTVLDTTQEPFGCRTLEFTTHKGFFLNGRHLRLNGVCQHHDLGCLGAAVNPAALERQFRILMDMGVNSIRTSHNPPAVEFMDLADRLGILVVSEAFDMWERPKTEFDYARFFPEWAATDVASWVRRDRNRPSIIMWSIGNEIYDTHADKRGEEVTRFLMEEVQKHDPAGNGAVTIGSNFMPWQGARNCADIVKFAGYNYGEKYYPEHHRDHPDWIIYGSETSSIVQSRGVYHFPARQSMLSDDDDQCSSLGNSATSWGAKDVESCITVDRDTPFSLGQYLWTGFDYIGEPTPYHTKNSYFGQIDTAGYPKDPYYLYQAAWTDWRTAPMIHIYPHWDWNPGQLIDVRVCSNAPRFELFLDGKSLGSRSMDMRKDKKLQGEWQIPWAPGVLEARAHDPEGRVIATDRVESFGDAVSVHLQADSPTLQADGQDLVFVDITVRDGEGRMVANANNRVEVEISGPGRLVGLDNGDSTDTDSYKGTSRRLFSGRLLAVVAATLDPGTIHVKVRSRGLSEARLAIQAMPASPRTLACSARNTVSAPDQGIPVRKITLVCPEGQAFSPGSVTRAVEARLSPPDATWTGLEWRLTNDAGIDTNLATLEVQGTRALIHAKGDGEFRLRCGTRNGGKSLNFYSQLEFRAEGLGSATFDPYGFITGGLYTRHAGEVGNGNDRGAATSRDSESTICYDRIDFGDWGSDEITIPLFVLDNDPFVFRISLGMPGEEGHEVLLEATYHKKSIWNTYQEQTWKLPRRLRGVVSLSFTCTRKAHFQGFRFTRFEKAFQTIPALEANRLYGDTFTREADCIRDIGNNVSLEFDHMDFGTAGCRGITICGRSSLAKNTIHVRFAGKDGEVKQIAEFAGSADWSEQEFDLPRMTGLQKVTFIFLPGCRFDFRWFRFR